MPMLLLLINLQLLSTCYVAGIVTSVLPAHGRHCYHHFAEWDPEGDPVRMSKFSKATQLINI